MESLEADGSPQFIHRTFAEYFTAVAVIEMLKHKDTNTNPPMDFVQKAVLETVKTDAEVGKSLKLKCEIFSFKHNVVCYFINSLLSDSANSSKIIQIHSLMSPSVMYACTHDGFQQIFTHLIGEYPLTAEYKCQKLLLAAVRNASIDFLRLVLSYCQPVTVCSKQMLYLAVERGDFSILNLIYEHDVTQKLLSEDSELPLQLMQTCVSYTQNDAPNLIKSKLEILKLFQRSAADPYSSIAHTDNLLLSTCVHDQLLVQLLKSCQDLLSADKQLKTVLHKAAEYLNPSQYQSLLLQIPSEKLPTLLNCQDVYMMTPLHCLVLHMQYDPLKETIEIFFNNKADFDAEDEFGYNVLRRAISSGRSKEFVEVLISFGANAYAEDKFGRNALHIAAMNWNKSLIQWLLKDQKLDLNSEDEDGNTPIYYCLYNENDESAYNSIQQFVELGAAVKIENHKGASPLHFAARQGHPKAFKFLRHGSVEDVKSVLKEFNLSQFVDLKNDKSETALVSFLNQKSVNLKILEYLASRWGKWRSEEISCAMKIVHLRRPDFETEEEYMKMMMIVSAK
ncbi:unnamed protein product [Orchesella dallaii]|uniref:Ankyrin repeat protein n=1 Tax=Orchesella dallaii TaxID=48710 RepID=A0ABP1RVI7_9HEXA